MRCCLKVAPPRQDRDKSTKSGSAATFGMIIELLAFDKMQADLHKHKIHISPCLIWVYLNRGDKI